MVLKVVVVLRDIVKELIAAKKAKASEPVAEPVKEAEPEAVVKCWTEGGELEVSGLCYGGDGALRLLANEPFECSPI